MKCKQYLLSLFLLSVATFLVFRNQDSPEKKIKSGGGENKNEEVVRITESRERLSSGAKPFEADIKGLNNEEFFEIFKGLDPSGRAYKERVLRVWENIQGEEFSSLEGGAAVQNGLVLPAEVSGFFSGEKISINDIEALKSESEKEMGEKAFWLFSMDSLSGGKLIPQLVNERNNELPPNSLDLAVLYSSMKAFKEINPIDNETELSSWSSMSRSRNPIYRLIALQASVVATPQEVQGISSEDTRYNLKASEAKNNMYQDYLKETDPFIVMELVKMISIHPCVEAKINLENLEGNTMVKSREILRQEIEIAKANIDRYIK